MNGGLRNNEKLVQSTNEEIICSQGPHETVMKKSAKKLVKSLSKQIVETSMCTRRENPG